MLDFVVENFSGCVFLAVILVALIPTIESKIAVPLGLSETIWGDTTLSPWVTFICAFIGSMLPCFLVIYIIRKLKNKTSVFVQDKFISKLQTKYKNRLEKIGSKSKTFYKLTALAMFVAVPLPLTGVYSGSLIAGLTNLKMWQCFLAIMVGEVISCLVILLLCTVFENSAFYVLLVSLILVILFVLFDLIFMFIRKHIQKRATKIAENNVNAK